MAETLVLWLILLVPIAAQVPLLLYMMRHIDIAEDPPRQGEDIWGPDGTRRWDESRPDRTTTSGRVPVCRHCRTENEPGYRFCQNCAGPL